MSDLASQHPRARGARVWDAVTACLGILSLVGFLPMSSWWIELCGQPRVGYTLAFTLICAVHGWRRRWFATAAYGVVALCNAAVLAPFHVMDPPPAGPRSTPMRMLVLNLDRRNDDHARALERIRDVDPDVLVAQELTTRWAGALRELDSRWPFSRTVVREDTFGIGVWSRFPLRELEVVEVGGVAIPALQGWLDVPATEPVRFLFLHPPAPKSPDLFHLRNRQLHGIPAIVVATRAPWLVAGDLNASAWSIDLRRMQALAGLRNSGRGFGAPATWPSFLGPFGVPIDHCLHTAEIGVRRHWLPPNYGSDHRPVVVDLYLPARAPDD